jgi:tetratricopeptide (TPR) repeat protein
MRLVGDIMNELKDIQVAFDKTHDVESIVKCVEGYHNLLNEVPDEPEILFQLGTAHLQLGQYGAAMVYFNRCLEFWPDNPHTWSNLGCCYRSLHILPEAREAFMKSLMTEEKAETYSNLASSYVNEDCPQEGLHFAEMAVKLAPDAPKGQWNAALLFLEMEDWEKGFSLYDAGFFCKERQMRNYSNETPDSVPWWTGEAA